MIEKALVGSKKYWALIIFLLIIMGIGGICYLFQWNYGLGITGMSRDVSWGIYIAQFTFLVGVAASAVMVVLPYYLHNYKAFGRITILGEFVAVSSVIMCLAFIIADLGQPTRAVNIILHPTPNSILFWDMVVLNGYLLLNILIGWNVLMSERKSVPPPTWVKPLIYLSIPWAVSIHTVTAFIYAGLPGRGFWLTAIMAPRFLASAFAGGPALLILLALIVRKFTRFDPGKETIQTLAKIVAYAMATNVFFILLEIFTVFYSQLPEHMHHFEYIFAGLEGHGKLVPWMWTSSILAVLALILLIPPASRKREGILALACGVTFASLWIEKGMSLVIAGFIPSPLGKVFEYSPTGPEISITLGIWAMGFFILTVLYKVAITVKEEVES
ncbi:MAG: NrfD/PsrC family molybdoenzyme membrane anchor subunit [Thermodesulfobacteriota bacterium]|nr:NrfD/PsrC family molybdoenzyme membrane anchor subunit [Thermodesulfobacteriota bacterium]